MQKTLQKIDVFLANNIRLIGIVFLVFLIKWPWQTIIVAICTILLIGLGSQGDFF